MVVSSSWGPLKISPVLQERSILPASAAVGYLFLSRWSPWRLHGRVRGKKSMLSVTSRRNVVEFCCLPSHTPDRGLLCGEVNQIYNTHKKYWPALTLKLFPQNCRELTNWRRKKHLPSTNCNKCLRFFGWALRVRCKLRKQLFLNLAPGVVDVSNSSGYRQHKHYLYNSLAIRYIHRSRVLLALCCFVKSSTSFLAA